MEKLSQEFYNRLKEHITKGSGGGLRQIWNLGKAKVYVLQGMRDVVGGKACYFLVIDDMVPDKHTFSTVIFGPVCVYDQDQQPLVQMRDSYWAPRDGGFVFDLSVPSCHYGDVPPLLPVKFRELPYTVLEEFKL